MSAITDILARPLIPIEIVITLAALAIILCLYAAARGLRGAQLRLASALALTMALLDPAIVREDREPRSDIVIAVVDDSDSQSVENRRSQTEAALATLQRQIEAMEAQPGAAPIELDVVRVAGDGARGTELAAATSKAISSAPPDRFAGAVLITDGAISDNEAVIEALQAASAAEIDGPRRGTSPIHSLITGRDGEFDRRLVVESAPAYGLVDTEVALQFRVEETGPAPVGAPRPRVTAYVDGERAAAGDLPVGRSTRFTVSLDHPGRTVVELRLDEAPGEITNRNNLAAFTINAVRDRLEVLLVSGEPHAGERTWRNLLKSDASVDLVHFTILRPPGKPNRTPVADLSLIPFPTRQLFLEDIKKFDLIIFDRYRNWRGILSDRYIQNIVDYVREGGAVLISSGEHFAGIESLFFSPLGEILPATPTGDVLEGAYRPRVTDLGARHPVTRGLPGSGVTDGADVDLATPSWGRWFRQLDVTPYSGDTLMSGAETKPLLVLDRVDEGRIALLASDHPWLWARGYDGGGPQGELLRRLAHWLMGEPELEEEALTAGPTPGGFEVFRRSLSPGDKSIDIVTPDGAVSTEALEPAGDGLWRAEIASEQLGVHRIDDAADSVIAPPGQTREPLSAIAVVGPPAPEEFANPVSTTERLAPIAAASGGGVFRLEPDGATPDFRRVSDRRAAAGGSWLGFPRREAYEVRGVTLGAVAPSWLFFLLAAGFAVAAWRVEGR